MTRQLLALALDLTRVYMRRLLLLVSPERRVLARRLAVGGPASVAYMRAGRADGQRVDITSTPAGAG